jgi:hypothetical protein
MSSACASPSPPARYNEINTTDNDDKHIFYFTRHNANNTSNTNGDNTGNSYFVDVFKRILSISKSDVCQFSKAMFVDF